MGVVILKKNCIQKAIPHILTLFLNNTIDTKTSYVLSELSHTCSQELESITVDDVRKAVKQFKCKKRVVMMVSSMTT